MHGPDVRSDGLCKYVTRFSKGPIEQARIKHVARFNPLVELCWLFNLWKDPVERTRSGGQI